MYTGGYVVKPNTKSRLKLSHHPFVVKHVTRMPVQDGCVPNVGNSSLELIHQKNNWWPRSQHKQVVKDQNSTVKHYEADVSSSSPLPFGSDEGLALESFHSGNLTLINVFDAKVWAFASAMTRWHSFFRNFDPYWVDVMMISHDHLMAPSFMSSHIFLFQVFLPHPPLCSCVRCSLYAYHTWTMCPNHFHKLVLALGSYAYSYELQFAI